MVNKSLMSIIIGLGLMFSLTIIVVFIPPFPIGIALYAICMASGVLLFTGGLFSLDLTEKKGDKKTMSELESLTPKEINERLEELLKKFDKNLEEHTQLVERYEAKLKEYAIHITKQKQLYQEFEDLMGKIEENRK